MSTNKRTNEEWRALLAEQRASGQTQEEWCAAKGVNLYTFRDRSSRIKKMDGGPEFQTVQPKTVTAGWMEVTPERLPEKAAGITIERDGWTVTVGTGFDAKLLTAALRAVSRACC
jgi:hypothetical protein